MILSHNTVNLYFDPKATSKLSAKRETDRDVADILVSRIACERLFRSGKITVRMQRLRLFFEP